MHYNKTNIIIEILPSFGTSALLHVKFSHCHSISSNFVRLKSVGIYYLSTLFCLLSKPAYACSTKTVCGHGNNRQV